MFISVYLEVQMSQQHWEENCPSPLNCLVSLSASVDHVWVGLLTLSFSCLGLCVALSILHCFYDCSFRAHLNIRNACLPVDSF